MLGIMMLIDESEDRELFKQLYHKYHNLMFIIANDILKNEYDAEDAVADTFLEIAKNFSKISAECRNFKAYYTLSVRNKAISIYNKKNQIKTTSLEGAANVSIDSFLENYGDNDIKEKIALLDPKYKYTFYMYYFEERNVKEIAKIMKISESCVYKYINKGKQQLIELMSDREVKGNE